MFVTNHPTKSVLQQVLDREHAQSNAATANALLCGLELDRASKSSAPLFGRPKAKPTLQSLLLGSAVKH